MGKKDVHTNKNDFRVPDGYFETFEAHLFEKIKNPSNVIPNEDGFKLPQKYFDTFEDKLFKKLNTSKRSKVIQFTTFKKYYYVSIGAAACIVLFFLINQFAFTNTVTFTTLENDEIENYLYTDEFSSNTYNIVQLYDDIELMEISFIDESLEKDDELINYLNENTDTYDQLIDEN